MGSRDRRQPGQDLLPVDTLVDHYRIVRHIGSGGMANVYLARDTSLGRRVALKVIRPEGLGSAGTTEKFLHEAQATARFNHPNIVTVYGVGEHEGWPYVALEFIEGQTVRERVRQEKLGVAEILRIGFEAGKALLEAHANGITHRDLKPENVMLSRDGRIRVLDFGLARVVDPGPSGSGEVKKGAATVPDGTRNRLVGTQGYMAPELWCFQDPTPAVDIWAMGVMFFELIEGKRPYSYDEVLGMSCEGAEDVPPPFDPGKDIPAGVTELVAGCLKVEPERRPGASDLVLRIRRILARGRAPGGEEANPFRGLLPFSEEHRHLFYGRDAEIAAFAERIRTETVMPVLGPSGAGKSSFVQAGVLPRLRERGPLRVISMRPGKSPFQTLGSRILAAERGDRPEPVRQDESQEERLRGEPHYLNLVLARLAAETAGSVVLFVDQAEELFTLVEDDGERQTFLHVLCSAADDPAVPVRVVFTLREEFLGRFARGASIREALSHITVLGSPGPEALAEILKRPVEAAGYSYDDTDLVKDMVEEVQGEASCLPLLQFAAEQLWQGRDPERKEIRRTVYTALGGVAGALARHADGVLSGMTSSELDVARRLLLRLVTGEGTRKTTARGDLLQGLGREGIGVLQRLTQARLVSVRQSARDAGGQIELVHESLIHAWRRLGRWIEESRDELLIVEEVNQAAKLWERHGHKDEELWRGAALDEAGRVLDRAVAELPPAAVRFLQASRRIERKSRKRRRLLQAGGVVALALVAAISLVFSVSLAEKERVARAERERAEIGEASAVREDAEASFSRGDTLEARAKLRTSFERLDSLHARALWARLRFDPLVWKREFGGSMWGAAFTPDGRTAVVAASHESVIYLLEADTLRTRVLRLLPGVPDELTVLDVSPDGQSVAVCTGKGRIVILDLAGGEASVVVQAHAGKCEAIRISPDGRQLASGGEDGKIKIFRLPELRVRHVIAAHEGVVNGVSFSPDSTLIASGGADHQVRVWNARTGAGVATLRKHGYLVGDVAFSPDGDSLISIGQDRTLRVWDTGTWREERVIQTTNYPWKGAFAPDGRRVAVSLIDGSIGVWDIRTGRKTRTLKMHRVTASGLAFDPGGDRLVSASYDRKVCLWDLGTPGAGPPDRGHRAPVSDVAFGLDGKLAVSADIDGTIRTWDVTTGDQVRVIRGSTKSPALGLSVSPDGRFLASGHFDATMYTWKLDTGARMRAFAGHLGSVYTVAFSPDGKTLASGSYDKTVRLWDVASGREKAILPGHTQPVNHVAFSAGGKFVASAGSDNMVGIWTPGRDKMKLLAGHTASVEGVVFLPDSHALVSASSDGTIRLWDADAGTGTLFNRSRGSVHRPDCDPQGARIGAPYSDRLVRIFDRSGAAVVELAGHRDEVNAVRFGPDGRLVVTGGDDTTVRLWDSRTGKTLWKGVGLLRKKPLARIHNGWVRPGEISPEEGTPGPEDTGWSRSLEERALRFTESSNGSLCVETTDGKLELWRKDPDRLLWSTEVGEVLRVQAIPTGCLVMFPDSVGMFDERGKYKSLADAPASAFAWTGNEILIAEGERVRSSSSSGDQVSPVAPGDASITAISRIEGRLVVGHAEGNIEVFPAEAGTTKTTLMLSGTPFGQVTRLIPGPVGTVVAGFAGGSVGVWSLADGENLLLTRLHGAVVDLFIEEQGLIALTELGDTEAIDLSVLYADTCTVLREIWERIPVTWTDGKVVESPAPRGHPCRRH